MPLMVGPRSYFDGYAMSQGRRASDRAEESELASRRRRLGAGEAARRMLEERSSSQIPGIQAPPIDPSSLPALPQPGAESGETGAGGQQAAGVTRRAAGPGPEIVARTGVPANQMGGVHRYVTALGLEANRMRPGGTAENVRQTNEAWDRYARVYVRYMRAQATQEEFAAARAQFESSTGLRHDPITNQVYRPGASERTMTGVPEGLRPGAEPAARQQALSDEALNWTPDFNAQQPQVGVQPPAQSPQTGASRAARNNNPGNIEYGEFAQSHGATGSDGRFAIFPTLQAGEDAQRALLISYMQRGHNTVQEIVGRWSPQADPTNAPNSTQNYVNYVANQLGVSPDQPLSGQQLEPLRQAMAEFEGGGVSNVSAPAGYTQVAGVQAPRAQPFPGLNLAPAVTPMYQRATEQLNYAEALLRNAADNPLAADSEEVMGQLYQTYVTAFAQQEMAQGLSRIQDFAATGATQGIEELLSFYSGHTIQIVEHPMQRGTYVLHADGSPYAMMGREEIADNALRLVDSAYNQLRREQAVEQQTASFEASNELRQILARAEAEGQWDYYQAIAVELMRNTNSMNLERLRAAGSRPIVTDDGHGGFFITFWDQNMQLVQERVSAQQVESAQRTPGFLGTGLGSRPIEVEQWSRAPVERAQ